MSTNCFHFSNHICGFRGSATPQGTSKQLGAKHVALHLEKTCKTIFCAKWARTVHLQFLSHSLSYVSLLNMSICKSARENWLEWELEGRKMWRDRRKPSLKRDNLFSSPDERQSFLTRDNGLGLEVIWWQEQVRQPTTDTWPHQSVMAGRSLIKLKYGPIFRCIFARFIASH